MLCRKHNALRESFRKRLFAERRREINTVGAAERKKKHRVRWCLTFRKSDRSLPRRTCCNVSFFHTDDRPYLKASFVFADVEINSRTDAINSATDSCTRFPLGLNNLFFFSHRTPWSSRPYNRRPNACVFLCPWRNVNDDFNLFSRGFAVYCPAWSIARSRSQLKALLRAISILRNGVRRQFNRASAIYTGIRLIVTHVILSSK